ncbi:MAG TPA: hypothetical protein PLM06_10065 [Anaerolineae bacterium]|nr:hypothetical protein [Anaerolineae bacterium]
MNTFNRIVVVLVLIALILLVSVLGVIPHVVLSDVGRWATTLGEQLWAAQVAVRLGVGVLLALIFDVVAIALIYFEVRPRRQRFIRVENLAGGMATVSVESVVRQLEYRLAPIPNVIAVRPKIRAGRGKVQAVVNVDVGTGANVPQMASRLVEEVKDVLSTEMGLQLAGEPEVRITVLPQPEGRRASQPQPAAPVAPVTPPTIPAATPQPPLVTPVPDTPSWPRDTGEPVV